MNKMVNRLFNLPEKKERNFLLDEIHRNKNRTKNNKKK